MDDSTTKRLKERAGLFLPLGFTAFWGAAAHIAMVHKECAKLKKWLTDQDFLDLIGEEITKVVRDSLQCAAPVFLWQ